MPAEEFPIEEFDGLPDWNAAAWENILVRDAQALPLDGRGDWLASRPVRDLVGVRAVLRQQSEAADLLQAVAAQLARRGAGA